jgi:hypothetical protein
MIRPEFSIFSDKFARMFLIFPSTCPNFHGFLKFGGLAMSILSYGRGLGNAVIVRGLLKKMWHLALKFAS